MKRKGLFFTLIAMLLSVVPNGTLSGQQADSTAMAKSNEEKKPVQWFEGKMVERPRLSIGGSAGLYAGTIFFNPGVSTSLYMAPTIGFVSRLQTSYYGGVQAELNYIQRGWSESYTDASTYKRDLHQIELAILGNLFFDISRARIFFNIGPQINYMLADKSRQEGSGFDENNEKRYNLAIKNRFGWGVAAGLGTSIYLGRRAGSIELEARFYYGFNNIFPSGPADLYVQSNEIGGVVKINYLFPLN